MPTRSFSLPGPILTFALTAGIAVAPWVAFGQTTVIEDFESYTVSGVVLDPTTVGGSGWTRDGAGVSDWDVSCCNGDIASLDRTFDGSQQFMALRRSNVNPPAFSDEITDFAIPTIVQGSVSLERNPSAASGSGFRMAITWPSLCAPHRAAEGFPRACPPRCRDPRPGIRTRTR